jgi:hypothetical protein
VFISPNNFMKWKQSLTEKETTKHPENDE